MVCYLKIINQRSKIETSKNLDKTTIYFVFPERKIKYFSSTYCCGIGEEVGLIALFDQGCRQNNALALFKNEVAFDDNFLK